VAGGCGFRGLGGVDRYAGGRIRVERVAGGRRAAIYAPRVMGGTANNRMWVLDVGLLALRLAAGGLLLFHGVHKVLHGVGPIAGMLTAHHLPGFLAYGTYVGEVVAPALVLVGVLTRPAAAVVAFNMVVAIGLAYGGKLASLTAQGGWVAELPALYLLAAVALICTGPGRLSVSRGKGKWA